MPASLTPTQQSQANFSRLAQALCNRRKTTTCQCLCYAPPSANTVCRPAENKTVPPVPCVWRCCYLYLTNVFSLEMPKSEATIQTVEVVCATSEPERWGCDGWKRREQKQTDVYSDSETSVFSTMAQKDGKQRAAAVYSRTLLLFLPLLWRACNEFSSLTLEQAQT